MTKRNDFDFLLMQSRSVETERQAARREAFQQMAQVLQNKPVDNSTQIVEPVKALAKAAKAKSTSC